MLEPIALGELNLSIEQFGALTIGQINALVDGYLRRRDTLEDMLITYSALPVYQTHVKHPPTYKKFVAYRGNRPGKKKMRAIPAKTADYWRAMIKEAEE